MLKLTRDLKVTTERVVLAVCVLLCAPLAMAENWPAWRGVHGDGVSSESDFPTEWDREKNVRWRVDMPERSNSTPIVWGERVFVTQAMGEGKRRTVLCLDRKTGDKVWQEGVDAVVMEPTHETNPYCSPSPVTDGERVIAWFGSAGLAAFDMDGNELWHRPLGDVVHMFGYGSSPVLHGDLCFLNFGPGQREFAVAVNKHTGEIVWQHEAPGPLEPPEVDEEGEEEDIHGTWSTPIVVGGELIFCFRGEITAFEPESGKQIWTCKGLGPQRKASPVAGEGIVVALGGMDSATLAVRLGGKGDVSGSHLAWSNPRARSRLGTGVIHRGHLYAIQRNGIVECIKLETGEVVWKKRHNGSGGEGDTWSSLFLAGEKIYAINQSADVFVIEAAPEYKLIATNSLGEYTNSTVVGSQGDLFIRTHAALWCIGE